MKHNPKTANPESAEQALSAELARIEAEIDALKAQGAEAAERADSLARERDAALLSGDFERVESIDRDRRHELTVERAAKLIPAAKEKLEAMRARLTDARWATDWKEFRAQVLALKEPIDAVVAGLARLDEIVGRANQRGNHSRAVAHMARAPRLPSGALVLDNALLATWVSAVAPETTPGLDADARPAKKSPTPPPAAVPARAARPPEPAAPPPPRHLASQPEPDGEGNATVVVLKRRPGEAFRIGETVKLRFDDALARVRKNEADFVEPDDLTASPSEIGRATAAEPEAAL